MKSRRYTRQDLCTLMSALADKVGRRDIELFIYGSAALLLNDEMDESLGPDAVAHDIDVFSFASNAIPLIRDARAKINAELAIGHPSWIVPNVINLSALASEPDVYFKRVLPALESKGLRVHVLRPEAQLALALKRVNANESHKAQVLALAEHLHITEPRGLMAVWQRHAGLVDTDQDRENEVRRVISDGHFWILPSQKLS